MKLDIKESIEQTSHKEAMARQASLASSSVAKVFSSAGGLFASDSSSASLSAAFSALSSMSKSLDSSTKLYCAEMLAAKVFKASPPTEGQPVAVYFSVGNLTPMLWSLIFRNFVGAFFPSSIIFSILGTLKSLSCGRISSGLLLYKKETS